VTAVVWVGGVWLVLGLLLSLGTVIVVRREDAKVARSRPAIPQKAAHRAEDRRSTSPAPQPVTRSAPPACSKRSNQSAATTRLPVHRATWDPRPGRAAR
jgi:hypothetical protein